MAMYVSGRKKEQMSSGSDEVKSTCDHCQITGQTVPAKYYCQVCREYLCTSCSLIHSKASITQNHKLLDVDTFSTQKEQHPTASVPIWQGCLIHPGEAIRLFCETHSALCCLICFTKGHKTCDIALTSDLAKDICTNENFNSFMNGLNQIENEKSIQEQLLKANKSKSESEYAKLIEDIKAVTERAHVHIDLLAEKTIKQACKARNDTERRLNEVDISLRAIDADINDVKKDIGKEENAQQEERLFIGWKRTQLKVERMKTDMFQMEEKNSIPLRRLTISKEVETMLNTSNGLGTVVSVKKTSVKVQTRTCSSDPCSVSHFLTRKNVHRFQDAYMAVVAIYLGIEFSTWAISFCDSMKKDRSIRIAEWWEPDTMLNLFTSTAILIKKDGETFDSFGSEAERIFANADNKESYFFFRRFTTVLLGLKDVDRNIKIQDSASKELSLRKVFVMAIQFMKANVEKIMTIPLKTNDLMFVVTAPVMYNDAAKLFIQEAAVEAGLNQDRLVIAHEPEVILKLCHDVPNSVSNESERITNFTAGAKFIVLNVGGIQSDITVYKVVDETGRLSEVHVASSSAWGRNRVNEEFLDFFRKYAGEECVEKFRENDPGEFEDLIRTFEKKTTSLHPSTTGKIRLKIPLEFKLAEKQTACHPTNHDETKLRFLKNTHVVEMDAQIARNCFNGSLQDIADYIRNLLERRDFSDCEGIIIAGKVSNMLQSKVKSSFPNLKIVIPDMPEMASVKGAVMLGHKLSVY